MSSRAYQAEFGRAVTVEFDRKYHEVLSLSLLDDDRERVTIRKGSIITTRNHGGEQIVLKLLGGQRSGDKGRWEYHAMVVSRAGD